MSRLTSCRFRDEGEQVSIILGGGRLLIKASVHGRLIERREYSAEREMAFGIASAAGHCVIVEE